MSVSTPPKPTLRAHWAHNRHLSLTILFICLILVAAVLFRLAFLKTNLPVSYIFDERVGLHLLDRLNDGTLRPGFFHYPTFYYYLTYAMNTAVGDFKDIIVHGRLLNIGFAAVLGIMVALLSYQIWQSSVATIFAVLFTIFAQIPIKNGRYIITDILMVTLILASLYCFTTFKKGGSWHWRIAAWVLCGMAAATKYTAGLLTIALIIAEIAWPQPGKVAHKILRELILAAVIIVSVIFLSVYIFWPQDYLLGLVQSQGSSTLSELDHSDVAFIEAMRTRTLVLAILTIFVGVALFFSKQFAERLNNIWVLAGPAIAVAVFLICSPSILMEPLRFVYDFGAEIKATTTKKPNMMWGYYAWVYWWHEALILLFLSFFGIFFGLRISAARPLLVFAAVYFITIASAHRGYIRYLTPLMPIVSVFAGGALSIAFHKLRSKHILAAVAALLVILTIWGAEMGRHLYPMLLAANNHDSHHGSYTEILRRGASQLVLMGVGPTFALKQQGVVVNKVLPKEALLPKVPGNYLLLDTEARQLIGADRIKADFELLWSDTRDTGQYLYVKTVRH